MILEQRLFFNTKFLIYFCIKLYLFFLSFKAEVQPERPFKPDNQQKRTLKNTFCLTKYLLKKMNDMSTFTKFNFRIL